MYHVHLQHEHFVQSGVLIQTACMKHLIPDCLTTKKSNVPFTDQTLSFLSRDLSGNVLKVWKGPDLFQSLQAEDSLLKPALAWKGQMCLFPNSYPRQLLSLLPENLFLCIVSHCVLKNATTVNSYKFQANLHHLTFLVDLLW